MDDFDFKQKHSINRMRLEESASGLPHHLMEEHTLLLSLVNGELSVFEECNWPDDGGYLVYFEKQFTQTATDGRTTWQPDAVFSDGRGNFCVVEVKYIDKDASGHTAQVKRSKKRKEVKEQTKRHVKVIKNLLLESF